MESLKTEKIEKTEEIYNENRLLFQLCSRAIWKQMKVLVNYCRLIGPIFIERYVYELKILATRGGLSS